MRPEYLTWQHSSHGRVTTCTDCHVPHTSVWTHYGFKAKDGLWHATVFTLRWEPQVIRLSSGAVPVVEQNCRRCHDSVISKVAASQHAAEDLRCWDCHREVPHGVARSLSAGPDVFRPELGAILTRGQQPRIKGRPVRPPEELPCD